MSYLCDYVNILHEHEAPPHPLRTSSRTVKPTSHYSPSLYYLLLTDDGKWKQFFSLVAGHHDSIGAYKSIRSNSEKITNNGL